MSSYSERLTRQHRNTQHSYSKDFLRKKYSFKPRLHQGNMLPGIMLPGRATCIRIHICWRTYVARQQVARSGYMLTVSRQHNYCSFRLVSLCIQQQTGNNFVADTRNMLTATCCRATCCPGVNAALVYLLCTGEGHASGTRQFVKILF